jgi:hypothetical protein
LTPIQEAVASQLEQREPPSERVKLKSSFPLGTVIAILMLIGLGVAWSLRPPEEKKEPRLVQTNHSSAPAPSAAPAENPPSAASGEPSPAERRLLTVLSRPSGASVEVDGGFVGKTPLVMPHTFEPNKSIHVVVQGEGYKRWEDDVTVDASGTVNVMAVLEPAK